VVYVTVPDITRMARRLKMPLEDFFEKHIRIIINEEGTEHFSLTEEERDGQYDCTFLMDGKCKVYLDRPAQCRTYPFWSHIVESEESWKEEMSHCEGIGRGEPADIDEVERFVEIDAQGRLESMVMGDDDPDNFESPTSHSDEPKQTREKL